MAAPVAGYENYTISENGVVTNIRTGKVLKSAISKNGYMVVSLWKNNKGTTKYIHRLIAEHFLLNENGYNVINHKDGNKLNNNIDNIEWVTYSINNQHAYDIGLKKVNDNQRQLMSKLATARNKVGKYRSVPINQVDEYGNLIREFNSIQEIVDTLDISRGSIRKILSKKVKSVKNIFLVYKER